MWERGRENANDHSKGDMNTGNYIGPSTSLTAVERWAVWSWKSVAKALLTVREGKREELLTIVKSSYSGGDENNGGYTAYYTSLTVLERDEFVWSWESAAKALINGCESEAEKMLRIVKSGYSSGDENIGGYIAHSPSLTVMGRWTALVLEVCS